MNTAREPHRPISWRQYAPSRWSSFVLLLGCMLAACGPNEQTQGNLSLGRVPPEFTATLRNGLLTMPVGTIVIISAEGTRTTSGFGRRRETESLSPSEMYVTSTDSDVADVRYHQDGLYAVIGADTGDAVLILRADDGESLRSIAVEVVSAER